MKISSIKALKSIQKCEVLQRKTGHFRAFVAFCRFRHLAQSPGWRDALGVVHAPGLSDGAWTSSFHLYYTIHLQMAGDCFALLYLFLASEK